jgi:hypothetical protein
MGALINTTAVCYVEMINPVLLNRRLTGLDTGDDHLK